MNPTASPRPPPASSAARARIAVSIPSRIAALGLDLTWTGSATSRPRHGSRKQDPLTRDRILAKRRVALLFYESSTRTRTSFELAAKALGADTTLVSSQLEH
jgi:ornithine carbamoyltransferase